MTNVKKLGLTALAGSLVATSGFAGALDVTGTAKVTYASLDEKEVTGNPYSMSTGMGFTGSGDLDIGTLSYTYSATNMAFSSSNLKLDMGDNGTVSFGNGAGLTGIKANYDKMPTAGEQVWDDLDGQANGISGMSNTNTLGYSTTFVGIGMSAAYSKDSGAGTAGSSTEGSSKSIALNSSDLLDGADIGWAHADVSGTSTNNGTDEDTVWIKYTAGAVTAGLQVTKIDKSAVNSDVDRTHAAVSIAVNENLSVSLGQSVVEFEASGKDDQENVGLAFSYTMGSMTIAGFQNTEDNTGGTQGTDDSVTELSVAFAF
jgi:outer membrane protein OmpU